MGGEIWVWRIGRAAWIDEDSQELMGRAGGVFGQGKCLSIAQHDSYMISFSRCNISLVYMCNKQSHF